MRLSICICSMSKRSSQLVRLLGILAAQEHPDVEVLVAVDVGDGQLGAKRNRLVALAQGMYVVHVDDDDVVSSTYVQSILLASEANPDAISVRGLRTDASQCTPPVVFDYRKMPGDAFVIDDDGVLWRSPGHLCAVRTVLAREIPFPTEIPEDLKWVMRLAPQIETITHAGNQGEILYQYLWDSQEKRWYET
jgi:hypothetical protein